MLIDFSELEKNKSFRSDMLYFIRMANPYIETIFWDVFSSNNKKHRKILYEIVSENLSAEKETEKYLLAAIVPDKDKNGRRGLGTMDCLSANFVRKVLDPFSKDVGFEQKLRENFAIFGENGKNSFSIFRNAVFTIYKRRNLLEHYDDIADKEKKTTAEKYNGNNRKDWENNGKKDGDPIHTDELVINALGLFILPELLAHFAGRVASYEKKLSVIKSRQQSGIIRDIIKKSVEKRRESTRILFAEERTRKNIKDKQRRKYLVSDNIPWKKTYNEMRQTEGYSDTDYKEHQFKLRYHFIGIKNINKIRKILSNGNSLHFKRDIEAFYLLTAKVNLLIHRFFQLIPKEDKKMQVGDDELSECLKKIRDAIAHNGLFWDVKKNNGLEAYSVEEVFIAVFRACSYSGGKNQVNDFYTQVIGLLKKQKFALVDIKGEPPKYLHIKQWTEKNRKKYLKNNNDGIRVDRRPRYQSVVAKWKKSLDNAKKEIEIS